MPWSPPPIKLEEATARSPQVAEPVTPTQEAVQFWSIPAPQLSTLPLVPPASSGKQVFTRKRLLTWLGLFLCIFALSSGIALWFFTHSGSSQSTATINGQVVFSQSGQNTQNGGYDTVQLDVHNLPPPPPGDVYYAWIESGASESFRPHWQLTVHDGSVYLPKQTSSAFHSLLQPDTILLITVEQAGTDPVVPNVEPTGRIAYAQLQPGQRTVFTIQQCPPIGQSNVCQR